MLAANHAANVINIITDAQWIALAWITLASLAATNVIKGLWRWSPLNGETAAKLNSLAFLLGIVFAYFLWPDGDGVPWWIGGLVSGLLTPVAFKFVNIFILDKFPAVQSAVNFDRRSGDNLPPSGVSERRK